MRTVVASQEPPDCTKGAKIPYVQYEANTRVEDVERVLVPELSKKVCKLMGFVGYESSIDEVVRNEGLTNLVKRF